MSAEAITFWACLACYIIGCVVGYMDGRDSAEDEQAELRMRNIIKNDYPK